MKQQDLARLALDYQDFICYIVDIDTYELLYMNKAGKSFFQNNENISIDKRKCYEFMYNRNTKCSRCNNKKLELGKRLYRTDPLGNKSSFTHVDSMIDLEGKFAKISMLYDNKLPNKRVDSALHKLSVEETLVDCIQTLTEEDDINASVGKLLSIIAKYYGANHAYFYEADEKAKTVTKKYEWRPDDVYSPFEVDAPLPMKPFEPIFDMFHTKGEFALSVKENELDKNSPLSNFLAYAKASSLLVVPFSINGEIVFCLGVHSPTKNTHDLSLLHSVILFVVDKVKKDRLHKQLVNLSYSDSLTELWNRNKFNERVEILENERLDTIANFHFGLNGLRNINELYGEKYGDSILKQLAEVLKDNISYEIYRYSGNEFVAICPHISADEFENLNRAIKKAFSKKKDFSVAIGSCYQFKKINIHSGLSQAYEIMYAEKQKFYKSKKGEVIGTRTNPVEIILNELKAGLFCIHLQPKVDLKANKIASAEALVRKVDKDGNKVSPDKFIPIYEAEGTIRHIDFFVLEEVCKLLQNLIRESKPIKIAVNFSRVTFISPNLVEEVVEICAKYNVPHKYIKIEITESIDKMDFEFLSKKLKSLKNAGFPISLDDFGAMHSNLLMLTMAEFSEVKIDKKLIDNITLNAKNRALVKNILKMITDLGTSSCVAEGVETKEQKDMLLDFGCTDGQGYYFYRPLTVDAFLAAYNFDLHEHQGIDLDALASSAVYPLNYNEMESILDSIPFSFTLFGLDTKLRTCNKYALEQFGLDQKEDLVNDFFRYSPEVQPNGVNSRELATQYLEEAANKGSLNCSWVHRTKQGKEFPTEVLLRKITLNNSTEEAYIAGFLKNCVMENSVDHDAWATNYNFNNQVSDKDLIATLLDISNEWLWTFNHTTREMMFFGEGYENLGLPKERFIFPETFIEQNRVHEDDLEEFMKACQSLARGEHRPAEIRFYLPDGNARYFRIEYRIIKDQLGNLLTTIGKVVDIEEKKRLATLFYYDELTKCNTKIAFETLAKEQLSAHSDSSHVMFMLDVNNLKIINRKFGYKFGDTLLADIAQNLHSSFREGDLIGRIGEDNFILFLKNTSDINIILEKVHLLEKALTQTYKTAIGEFTSSGNIGIALYPQNGHTYDELYASAEKALVQAEADENSSYIFYSKALDGVLPKRVDILENAIITKNEYFDTELIANSYELLYSSNDVNIGISKAMQYVGQYLDVDRVYILRSSDEGNNYSIISEWSNEGIFRKKDMVQNAPCNQFGSFFDTLYEKDVIYSNEICVDECKKKYNIDKENIKSFFYTHAKSNEYTNLVLAIDDYKHYRTWTEQQINTLQNLTKMMALYVLA